VLAEIVNNPKPDRNLILFLRLGALFCFAGWTWVHFYWEGPYGVLLWQDTTYALAERLGISWDAFVGTGADDGLVQKWIAWIGWLYLGCMVLTITVRRKSRIQMAALVGGSGLLTIVAYTQYLAAQRQLPMFLEHGGQILIPVILVMALSLGVRHRVTVVTAIAALIATFAGHGCYALDLWPLPANFWAMTSVILEVEYETARSILQIAGILDFVVCLGICIPTVRRSCALYAAIWGFLTALARPVAGMSLGLNYWGADQFLHEAVLRAPHFLIPLYLFVLWRPSRQTETLASPPESTPESADAANVRSGDRAV
jgi:hypothetical protein